MADPEPHTVHAQLWPAAWEVQCPACRKAFRVDQVAEGPAGDFFAVDEDQFILCEGCGVLLEVDGVQFVPKERGDG